MEDLFYKYLAISLTAFFDIFHNAHMRNYWLFLLFAAAILFVHYLIRKQSLAFATQQFFARHVWLSKSAYVDYVLLLINPLIRYVIVTPVLIFLASYHTFFEPYLQEEGVLSSLNIPALWPGGLLTLSLFLMNDFLRFWLHYVQHRIPVLWEFHKVHHSAEALNFATTERFHPFDVLFFQFGVGLGAFGVNALFIWLFGNQIDVLTLFGANGLWVLANLAGGVLRHSPADIRFGSPLERWFISPAMHQIHHSSYPQHIDKNFGGTFAVWDRWFGTLYIPQNNEERKYGIGAETVKFRSVLYTYFHPIGAVGKRVARGLVHCRF